MFCQKILTPFSLPHIQRKTFCYSTVGIFSIILNIFSFIWLKLKQFIYDSIRLNFRSNKRTFIWLKKIQSNSKNFICPSKRIFLWEKSFKYSTKEKINKKRTGQRNLLMKSRFHGRLDLYKRFFIASGKHPTWGEWWEHFLDLRGSSIITNGFKRTKIHSYFRWKKL